MPQFATPQDARIQEVIESWRETAASEVDAIMAWLDMLDPSLCQDNPPAMFYGRTAELVGWISEHHPGLDPAPIQDVYAVVTEWHNGRNAARVPDALFTQLEEAMMVLNVMEAAIRKRLTTDDSATMPTKDDDADAQLAPDDGQCWVSATEIKRERGIAKGTLTKWAKTNPEIRRDATLADRERLKTPNLVHVWNERLIRNKLGSDTDDE